MREWTYDPHLDGADPDEPDIEDLIELGRAEFYGDTCTDAPGRPPRYVDSIRPATRAARAADKRSVPRAIPELPAIDTYQPPARP
ncbi:hypothetical protein AB4225_06235 [Streptomyces sp. 2RAF24]|uniref:hypothetical protein n=1 Tax=Streptomyces sp. 2RAF24 TaxID=3232997 RepID=UPI003F9ACCC0